MDKIMKNQCVRTNESWLYYDLSLRGITCFQVPGLAENRPSVLKGDWLFVRKQISEGNLENKEYKGYVHNVTLSAVWLRFSRK